MAAASAIDPASRPVDGEKQPTTTLAPFTSSELTSTASAGTAAAGSASSQSSAAPAPPIPARAISNPRITPKPNAQPVRTRRTASSASSSSSAAVSTPSSASSPTSPFAALMAPAPASTAGATQTAVTVNAAATAANSAPASTSDGKAASIVPTRAPLKPLPRAASTAADPYAFPSDDSPRLGSAADAKSSVPVALANSTFRSPFSVARGSSSSNAANSATKGLSFGILPRRSQPASDLKLRTPKSSSAASNGASECVYTTNPDADDHISSDDDEDAEDKEFLKKVRARELKRKAERENGNGDGDGNDAHGMDEPEFFSQPRPVPSPSPHPNADSDAETDDENSATSLRDGDRTDSGARTTSSENSDGIKRYGPNSGASHDGCPRCLQRDKMISQLKAEKSSLNEELTNCRENVNEFERMHARITERNAELHREFEPKLLRAQEVKKKSELQCAEMKLELQRLQVQMADMREQNTLLTMHLNQLQPNLSLSSSSSSSSSSAAAAAPAVERKGASPTAIALEWEKENRTPTVIAPPTPSQTAAAALSSKFAVAASPASSASSVSSAPVSIPSSLLFGMVNPRWSPQPATAKVSPPSPHKQTLSPTRNSISSFKSSIPASSSSSSSSAAKSASSPTSTGKRSPPSLALSFTSSSIAGAPVAKASPPPPPPPPASQLLYHNTANAIKLASLPASAPNFAAGDSKELSPPLPLLPPPLAIATGAKSIPSPPKPKVSVQKVMDDLKAAPTAAPPSLPPAAAESSTSASAVDTDSGDEKVSKRRRLDTAPAAGAVTAAAASAITTSEPGSRKRKHDPTTAVSVGEFDCRSSLSAASTSAAAMAASASSCAAASTAASASLHSNGSHAIVPQAV